jgi:hypothetical protein
MRREALFALAFMAPAMADEPGYRLRIDSNVEASQLIVVPVIAAPAGSRLRYEMVSSKQGPGGNSNTRQSGGVQIGADSSAKLSTLRVGVGADDRYVITVRVFDGVNLVAEQLLRHPPQEEHND